MKIRRRGFPEQGASFDNLNDARRLMREVMGDHDRGHKIDRLIGHRISVGHVIDEAIAAIDSGRRKTKGRMRMCSTLC